MDCYILHIDLLVNISRFLIVAISYHYEKHRSKLKKSIIVLEIQTWRIMNFKKFELEIVRNLCFDIIIKFEDSDFNILTVEKSYENMTFDINI